MDRYHGFTFTGYFLNLRDKAGFGTLGNGVGPFPDGFGTDQCPDNVSMICDSSKNRTARVFANAPAVTTASRSKDFLNSILSDSWRVMSGGPYNFVLI